MFLISDFDCVQYNHYKGENCWDKQTRSDCTSAFAKYITGKLSPVGEALCTINNHGLAYEDSPQRLRGFMADVHKCSVLCDRRLRLVVAKTPMIVQRM